MPAAALAQHRGLIAFDAGAKLQVEPGAELPKRICVAPWGDHDTAQGLIRIGEPTLAQLAGNQRATNFDRIALDFQHNTVPGSPAYRGEPVKVAAHARPTVVAGEGIVYEDVEWTPEGREYVGGRHYIDLSPTLRLNADGYAVFIHSAAVCRQGAIPGLTLFSAEQLPDKLLNSLQTLFDTPLSAPDPDMELKPLLLSLLGLQATATDDQITSRAQELAPALTALSASLKSGEKLVALSAGHAEVLTALSAGDVFKSFAELPKKFTDMLEKVAKLEGFHTAAERNEIVRNATLAGRAIPQTALEGETALSNLQLKALCAELPVTVPLDRRTVTLSADPAPQIASTAELTVLSALGLSKEQVDKYTK